MKNKNNFTMKDILLYIADMHKELIDMLKERFPIPVNHDETDYRDASDAKRELKVSDSTLWRWRKEGLIDFVIRKGKIYYDISSVLRKKKWSFGSSSGLLRVFFGKNIFFPKKTRRNVVDDPKDCKSIRSFPIKSSQSRSKPVTGVQAAVFCFKFVLSNN